MTYGIAIDTTALLAALRSLGAEIDKELNAAARVSADNIQREAQARLQRQLGPNATGKTVAGITVEPLSNGYAVIARRNPYPILPYWLEKGTVKMPARPFFDAAVELERGAFLRRVEEAVQTAIDAKGLGD